MKVTIITDNTVYDKKLRSEWGFSALIEVENTPHPEPEQVRSRVKILFDTGASGEVLLYNMSKLNIDPKRIECVFISHDHWDHTGGLKDFLKLNDRVKLYVPQHFSSKLDVKEFIKVKESLKIYENVFSTGELMRIEQSLILKLDKGLVVIAGCSHPGVGNILKSASKFGKVFALIGGLHGFREFDLIKNLELVCATHCTQYKEEIKKLYPDKFVEGGSGKIIEID
ncbi:MAG: MBL fold metallo-hydrolase [Candidatus Omnitrophica bacterium 4484_49]|nr:MAG: MBL fold metallo-hydrolase [Candidatus Omnitrophica bacterium 4484_49]